MVVVAAAAASACFIVVLVQHGLCNNQASIRRLHDKAKPHDGFGVTPFLKIQNDT